MDQILDLLLQFLTQFAGGPDAAENNLVRFALSAIAPKLSVNPGSEQPLNE